jgi:hypothetical protein
VMFFVCKEDGRLASVECLSGGGCRGVGWGWWVHSLLRSGGGLLTGGCEVYLASLYRGGCVWCCAGFKSASMRIMGWGGPSQ